MCDPCPSSPPACHAYVTAPPALPPLPPFHACQAALKTWDKRQAAISSKREALKQSKSMVDWREWGSAMYEQPKPDSVMVGSPLVRVCWELGLV